MNERIFVQPAPGLLVRKPVGGYLLEKGEWVNRETYWLRRLNDGDVAETEDPDAAAEPAATAAPAAELPADKPTKAAK